MKLSPLVRTQLIIFTIVSLVSTVFTGIYYLRIPAALSIGRYHVTVELPTAGGLYQSANVTYDGHTIGRVTSVDLHPNGVRATLSLIDSVRVPSALTARVRSMSAIGEQYVDLQPSSNTGPYLHDGSTIPVNQVRVADQIGPILDQTRTILASLPPGTLHSVLDQAARALGGEGGDLAQMLDSTTNFVDALAANGNALVTLVQQLTPLLNTQLVSSTEIRSWAQNLADLTDQLRTADPAVRDILQRGPAAADQADQLFQQLAPTLPLLLTNMTTLGQVALTYNPAIEQVLVLLPPLIAGENTAGKRGVPDGAVNVVFSVEVQDPAACTTGYLPANQRRMPTDTGSPATPSDLYCNVPQNSPFAVRGMRNLPCLNNPGVRAATPEQCLHGARPPSGDNNPGEIGPTPAAAAPPHPAAAHTTTPAPAVAHYLPDTPLYLTPDGTAYRHIEIGPNSPPAQQDPAWTQLLTAPIP
ncbi:MCE family protein [Nocardia sp. CA2R105]|uniref:MCE family protein n=1 Tax=Nocardia coffeae TaxID=2873381 RepID=UPI001CA74D1C|nr:MlaD family protein [Nocardia coffeae]MBY8857442.1 MCE family protein [Nocardia coffeae]